MTEEICRMPATELVARIGAKELSPVEVTDAMLDRMVREAVNNKMWRAGFTADGLPVGLQIVGRHLADADVLRASAAFESAAPWAAHWPTLP